MFVQFRFRDHWLLTTVRNRILERLPVITDPFLDPADGQSYWVDHVEVPDALHLNTDRTVNVRYVQARGHSGAQETIRVPQVQIWVPVRVFLALSKQVEESGTERAATLRRIDLVLFLNIDTVVDSSGVALSPKLSDIALPKEFKDSFLKASSGFVEKIPIPLDGIYAAVGSRPALVAAGVAADNNVIAIAVQLGLEGRDSAYLWTEFYKAELLALPAGHDWGILQDHAIAVAPLERRIAEEIGKHEQIHLTHSPIGTLENIGGSIEAGRVPESARLTISLKGEIRNISFEAWVTADISIESGSLKLHMKLKRDLDDFDVLLAALKASLVGALAGAVSFSTLLGPVGIGFGAMITSIAAFTAVIVFASVHTVPIPAKVLEKAKCEDIGEDTSERICKMELALPKTLGPLSPSSVGVTASRALMVSGTLSLPVLGPSELRIVQPFEPWEWFPQHRDEGGRHLLQIWNQVQLFSTGPIRVQVGSYKILSPWAHIFTVSVKNGADVLISAEPPHEYWTSPPPFRLLLHTNLGVRILEMPAPVRPSEKEIEERLELSRRAAEDARTGPIREIVKPGGVYSIGSSVLQELRPEDRKRWEVVLDGFPPGQSFSVLDVSGRTIALARSPSQGSLRLHNFSSPEKTGPIILRNEQEQIDTGQRRLMWRETNWHLVSLLTVGPQVRAVATAYNETRPVGAVLESSRLLLFDLHQESMPRLIDQAPVAEAGGMAAWQGGWLIGTAEGLLQRKPGRSFSDSHVLLPARPVVDLAATTTSVFVLYGGEIEILDGALQWAGRVEPGENAAALAIVGKTLAVAGTDGVKFFDIAVPTDPALLSSHPWQESSLVPVRAYASRGSFYFVQGEQLQTFHVSSSNRPEKIAKYPQSGDVGVSAVINGRMVHWDQTGQVAVYARGEVASNPPVSGRQVLRQLLALR